MDGHGIFEFEFARDLRHGVLDQPDVRRRASHVVGDKVWVTRGAAGIGRRHHPRSRARHHSVDRGVGDQLRGDRAPVALHHQQVTVETLGREFGAQTREVTVEHRLNRGIHRRRHAALVLAIFRQDGVAGRDIGIGPQAAHDLRRPPLMRRIDIAVQEMDDDGLAAQRQQLLRDVGHSRLVERHKHLAIGVHALRHFEPEFALNQRPESAPQAVGLRPSAAAEFQHVAEAPGSDEADPRDLAFQQRIGRGGRAVHHGLESCRIGASLGQRRHEADGLVVARRRHLGELDRARDRIDGQQIGKGAADIDADREGALWGHDHTERYCSRREESEASSAIVPPKRIWPFSMI